MPHYDTIDTKDGDIKGELADGGVVTIPDKAWTDVDENTLEGNWEQVTKTIVEDVINTGSLETDDPEGTLSVDHDRFVDTIADSSIVEHKKPETKRQRAELLLEHLICEGVYERRGREIVVLDKSNAPSDEFARLNWAVFFSQAGEKIDSVIQSAESQREAAAETIENETQTQLAADIQQMSRLESMCLDLEQKLRESAIEDTVDMPDISGEIQHIQKQGDSILETSEKQVNEGSELEQATDASNKVTETDRLPQDSSQE